MFRFDQIPERFRPAVLGIQHLETTERYVAAFIFGSVARGDSTDMSDLDVRVVVDGESSCAALNHPTVGGVKLDLTFLSLSQLTEQTRGEVERGARIPMVAESVVVFDKTGGLTRLQRAAREARPRPCSLEETRAIRSGLHHADDKAKRALTTDPSAALLVMHTSFLELLKAHYRIRSRWQVSDKRVLGDLRSWDPALARLVERFVSATDARIKFSLWTEIVDVVLLPIGGRKALSDTNCPCELCRRNLDAVGGPEEH